MVENSESMHIYRYMGIRSWQLVFPRGQIHLFTAVHPFRLHMHELLSQKRALFRVNKGVPGKFVYLFIYFNSSDKKSKTINQAQAVEGKARVKKITVFKKDEPSQT